jgi:hypothetical protein
MEETRFGTELQQAYRELVHRYAPHITIAATLTLKQHALVRVRRFENVRDEKYECIMKLNDAIISSTARRFESRLTHYLYGNQTKHKKKAHYAKPLILVAVEGRNTHKLAHFHIALGNIPADKQADIALHIKNAWYDCDFGNEQIRVKPLTDECGWLDYITKEVGYTDNDVLAIEHACIPAIIQQSI